MGRKLAFNREEALQKVMESFWSKGYRKTSMRALAGKLGLHLGSVYNTMGSKEKVFEEALRLHFDTHALPRLRALEEHPDPLRAIEDFLSNVAVECSRPEQSYGCFLINSLHEITKINPDVTDFVHQTIRRQEKAFAHTISRAQRQGQIAPEKDAGQMGCFMTAILFSMWSMSKMGVPGETIQEVKNCAITALKG